MIVGSGCSRPMPSFAPVGRRFRRLSLSQRTAARNFSSLAPLRPIRERASHPQIPRKLFEHLRTDGHRLQRFHRPLSLLSEHRLWFRFRYRSCFRQQQLRSRCFSRGNSVDRFFLFVRLPNKALPFKRATTTKARTRRRQKR